MNISRQHWLAFGLTVPSLIIGAYIFSCFKAEYNKHHHDQIVFQGFDLEKTIVPSGK